MRLSVRNSDEHGGNSKPCVIYNSAESDMKLTRGFYRETMAREGVHQVYGLAALSPI